MLGYWNNPVATAQVIDADGWFHTGDCVRIEDEHTFITGRIKEIIVMANGENVPPGDMENAIVLDSLFLQAIVRGEARPYLTALVVLDKRAIAEPVPLIQGILENALRLGIGAQTQAIGRRIHGADHIEAFARASP